MHQSQETESNPEHPSRSRRGRSDPKTAQARLPAVNEDETGSQVPRLGFLAQRIKMMNIRELVYQRQRGAVAQEKEARHIMPGFDSFGYVSGLLQY